MLAYLLMWRILEATVIAQADETTIAANVTGLSWVLQELPHTMPATMTQAHSPATPASDREAGMLKPSQL